MVLVIVLGVLALAPFALIMLTSFVKISVVLSICAAPWDAAGAAESGHHRHLAHSDDLLMSPVVEKMYAEAGGVGDSEAIFSEVSVKTLFEAGKRGREPLRAFLETHAHRKDRRLFLDLARRMAVKNGNNPEDITLRDFRTLVPSFVTSQLTEAFKIGFLLFTRSS